MKIVISKDATATIRIPEEVTDRIERIEDMSDEMMARMRIHFKNGYQLSVIKGEFSYGGPEGLYEIAPFGKGNTGMDGSILGIDGDDVRGRLSVEEVRGYILEMSELR